MIQLLGKVARLSPASLFRLLSEPAMLPVRLRGPKEVGPVEAAMALCPGLPLAEAKSLMQELHGKHEFFDAWNRVYFPVRRRRVALTPWNEFIYILVRARKPELIVETGIFDGQSSSIYLEALHTNGSGQLVSIDLPADDSITESTDRMAETSMPPGRSPGWMIPDFLRERHRLLLGDAKILLPQVCAQHDHFDIFMHDSLHTYEHMLFEYRVAWPKLLTGGLLLSDDIFWNPAFHQFCTEHHLAPVAVSGFGGALKP